jgi:hypothetical protein
MHQLIKGRARPGLSYVTHWIHSWPLKMQVLGNFLHDKSRIRSPTWQNPFPAMTSFIFYDFLFVQLIKHPILRIPNFNFPNLSCIAKCFFFLIQRVILAFLGVFWYQSKTFNWKKNMYSQSKQTKYSGFVKLGVWWAERDIYLTNLLDVFRNFVHESFSVWAVEKSYWSKICFFFSVCQLKKKS